MKKAEILIGTNFTEESSRAIAVGLHWAEVFSCLPSVVHVVSDFTAEDEISGFDAIRDSEKEGGYLRHIEDEAIHQIESQIEKINGATGGIKQILNWGEPSQFILERAALRNSKLIVLGADSNREGHGNYIGVTGSKIIHRSKVPVLVVKETTCASPKKILWLVSGENPSLQNRDWVEMIAGAFDSEVIVAGITPARFWGRHRPSQFIQDTLEQDVQYLRRHSINANLDLLKLELGKGRSLLSDYISRISPDLIVTDRDNNWVLEDILFGSELSWILEEAHCSLLVSYGKRELEREFPVYSAAAY